jgi:hypothetical protein
MGLWGVLFEIVKAVAPHAAPHVTKAVVNAAKDRRASKAEPEITTLSNEELASLLAALERRLTVAETREAAAEHDLEALQAEFAQKWKTASMLVMSLLAWNVLVSLLLIYFAFIRR